MILVLKALIACPSTCACVSPDASVKTANLLEEAGAPMCAHMSEAFYKYIDASRLPNGLKPELAIHTLDAEQKPMPVINLPENPA